VSAFSDRLAAIAVAAILFFAAIFHAYWAIGGRLGYAVAIPQFEDGAHVFEPSAFATWIVALLIAMAGIWILASAKVLSLPIPLRLLRWGTALMTLIFLYRAIGPSQFAGFLKQVRNTEFARFDTWFYSPLCLVIACGLAYLTWRSFFGDNR
jgi:hypothetical protein